MDEQKHFSRSLYSGFLSSAERFAERPALEIGDDKLTYAELKARAAAIAATLNKYLPDAEPALTAVFGHRSSCAFSAILGVLMRGHGYVPLNPMFPSDRTRAMLDRSACQALIVDRQSSNMLAQVLDVEANLTILLPEHSAEETAAIAAIWPKHRFLGEDALLSAERWQPVAADPDTIAYLLFTSGSTGQPKGVMVAHRNVIHFIDLMIERYKITEEDRFSQTFDLTFDLSVFDMFVAWKRGACLCVPTQAQKMLPGRYINSSNITIWFSVPSTGILMNRLRQLKPDQYPHLRISLFCGEALPVELAQRWLQAAPNAILENLYGPTELTIACTLYRWDSENSPAESELGMVPIGEPYAGMQVLIADEQLKEVPTGEAGELLMTGPQLTLGYYQDAERTAAAFVTPPGKNEVFYRTGDRVRCAPQSGQLIYLGRLDNQIKIQGYRVELGEIEAVLRDEAKVDAAVALGWPVTTSGADGIVAFIAAEYADTEAIKSAVQAHLPSYMQPREIRTIVEFPLNANGKIDRRVLLKMLDET